MNDLPPFLRISQEDRRAAWVAKPPRPMPLFQDKPRNEDQLTEQFRLQVEEEKRLASLNKIFKMKTRLATPKDLENYTWDSRRNQWVKIPSGCKAPVSVTTDSDTDDTPTGIEALNKDNARAVAELNGVWKPEYETLKGGLLTMTVKNRLKRLVKDGRDIVWK